MLRQTCCIILHTHCEFSHSTLSFTKLKIKKCIEAKTSAAEMSWAETSGFPGCNPHFESKFYRFAIYVLYGIMAPKIRCHRIVNTYCLQRQKLSRHALLNAASSWSFSAICKFCKMNVKRIRDIGFFTSKLCLS